MSGSVTFDVLARDRASATLKHIGSSADGLHSRLARLSSGALRLAKYGLIGGATAATAGFVATLHTGIHEVEEYQTGLAQLTAGLESTHGASNMTAKGMEELAKQIQGYSGQTDDSIVATEQLLLTFTKLHDEAGKGNDIFTRTTKLAADMAARFGGDASASAVKLGKAMQDPVKGMTSLTRIGVIFTDKQKEVIKKLVESGHTMQAQKMILGELDRKFAGSAKAVGDTLPGQINKLKRSFEDFSQSVVEHVLPVLFSIGGWLKDQLGPAFTDAAAVVKTRLVPTITDAFGRLQDWFDQYKPDLKQFTSSIVSGIKQVGGDLIGGLTSGVEDGDWKPLGEALGGAIGTTLKGLLSASGALSDALGSVNWGDLGVTVGKKAVGFVAGFAIGFLANSGEILTVIKDHWWDAILAVFSIIPVGRASSVIGHVLEKIPVLRLFAPLFRKIGGLGKAIEKPVFKVFGGLGTFVLHAIERGLGKAEGATAAVFRRFIGGIVYKLFSYIVDFHAAGVRLMRGLARGIARGIEWVVRQVARIVEAIIGPFRPSGSWLVERGAAVIAGLVRGIGKVANAVSGRIGSVVHSIIGAFAGAGGWLLDAGARILGGLLQGLKNAASGPIDFVKGVARSIVDHFPHSPAKEGPLHDHPPHTWGIAIMEGFVKGLQARESMLKQQLTNVADKLSSIRDASRSLSADLRDSLRGAFDLSNAPNISAKGITSFLSTGAAQTKRFVRLLARLVKAGYLPGIVQQIAAMGVGQGTAAALNLLAASPKNRHEINRLERQLDAYAATGGRVVARQQYGRQIDRLQNRLDRLHDDLVDVKHALRDQAKALRDAQHTARARTAT
jgi:hypothetical protein